MKPDEKKLERWMKSLLKGKSVSEQDLLFHWNGLGKPGSRALIAGLNKSHGWGVFFFWMEEHPEAKRLLPSLVNEAGITDEALEYFRSAGIPEEKGETPRKKAAWIVTAALDESRKNWEEAFRMLRGEIGLLEGTLPMLENAHSASATTFLSELARQDLPDEQAKTVRKALYRLRQLGLEPERTEPDAVVFAAPPAELFAFGENLFPHWQPVFYFRSQSPFSQSGDLYFFMVEEGETFEISEQHGNIKMNVRGLRELTSHYSTQFKEKWNLPISFRPVSPDRARWFLRRSCELLEGTPSGEKMSDFVRGMPPLADLDPLDDMRSLDPSITAAEVKQLLAEAYFTAWLIPSREIQPYLTELEEVEKGPIILPDAEIRERKQQVFRDSLQDYFQERNRRIWSFSFEKAGWFLKDSDPHAAELSLRCAAGLTASELDIAVNPVAWELFSRSVEYTREMEKASRQEEKRTSLIMSPREFQRLHSKE